MKFEVSGEGRRTKRRKKKDEKEKKTTTKVDRVGNLSLKMLNLLFRNFLFQTKFLLINLNQSLNVSNIIVDNTSICNVNGVIPITL